MPKKTHYEWLRIGQTATISEIHTAYRLLGMKTHPAHSDRPDKSEEFRRIGSAFIVLRDGSLRTKYDASLRANGSGNLTAPALLSVSDAEALFDAEMSNVAHELVGAGYDTAFIEQALTEEGCPRLIAAAASIADVSNKSDAQMHAPSSRGGSLTSANEDLATGSVKSKRFALVTAGVSFVLLSLSYFFVYLPNIQAKEQEARILEGRAKAAEVAAKQAADDAKAALEKVAEAARKLRDAEQRAESRGNVGSLRDTAPMPRVPNNLQDRDAVARRDAQDFATLNALGTRCQALSQQVAEYIQAAQNLAGGGVGAMFHLQIYGSLQNAAQRACNEYNIRLSERRNYEAMRR